MDANRSSNCCCNIREVPTPPAQTIRTLGLRRTVSPPRRSQPPKCMAMKAISLFGTGLCTIASRWRITCSVI